MLVPVDIKSLTPIQQYTVFGRAIRRGLDYCETAGMPRRKRKPRGAVGVKRRRAVDWRCWDCKPRGAVQVIGCKLGKPRRCRWE